MIFTNPPVLAMTDADLEPASLWQEELAKADTVAAVDKLLRYATPLACDATKAPSATRALLPRRIGGAMMVWRRIRPEVEAGAIRNRIDYWLRLRANDMVKTFDTLHWGNNLDAAGAMAVYATGDALDDDKLRKAGLRIAGRVLANIDPDGFTVEIKRPDNQKKAKDAAEYYSHETMIYLVALAGMVPSMWGDAAIKRAGALLDADLGTGARYAAKTGHKQIAYPSAAPGPIPSGFLGRWMPAFLAQYGSEGYPNLARAAAYYDANPARMFNATIGG